MQPKGTLEICTVNLCSLQCDYCGQTTLLKAQKSMGLHPNINKLDYMTFDIFKKCIDKLPLDIWIDFSGFVEPSLNPELSKFILYAHSKGFKIRLYTTGEKINRAFVDEVKHVPFVVVVWHVPDNQGILKATVNNEYCASMNYLCENINSPMYAHCFGEIHPIIQTWKNNNAFRHRGQSIYIEPKKLTNEHLITRASTTRDTSLVQLQKPQRKVGNIVCKPIWHKHGNRINHNVLLYNGLVVLCCCGYSLNHKLGNLADDLTSYDDLFSSAEYNRVLSGWNDDSIEIDCRYCELALTDEERKLDENRR